MKQHNTLTMLLAICKKEKVRRWNRRPLRMLHLNYRYVIHAVLSS